MNAYNRHIFFVLLCVITDILVISADLSAQRHLAHDKHIEKISVDSIGNIVIYDGDNLLLNYKNESFEKITGSTPVVRLLDNRLDGIYVIDRDGLKMISGDDYYKVMHTTEAAVDIIFNGQDTFIIYPDRLSAHLQKRQEECKFKDFYSSDILTGTYLLREKVIVFDNHGHSEPCADISYRQIVDIDITCTERYDHMRVLIGTRSQGIWMYKNDQYKQFYLPGIALPKSIKSLNYRTPKLWIHTLDSLLYVYDENKHILEKVDNGVIDYDIDRWNCLYLNKGNYIEINTTYANDELPYVKIGEVRSGYHVIDETQNMSFSRYQNSISVHLISHYPSSPQSVKYEYRNESNGKWKQLDSDQLYLTDIPPGDYHLQIRATANQVHYTSPVGFRYSIASDWRDTLWPIIFGVLSFLLVALLLSMRKAKRDKDRIVSDKKSTELQLAKIKSEQKLWQAQMSPHFIFNALNSISGLIAMSQNKQARKALNDLSQMMRMTLDNSSEESIDIKDEIRFLKKYLSVEKAIRSDSFVYNIMCEITDATIPPMIIQPFIENAIIHGVSGLQERTGKIIVSISENTSYITAVVQDNGVGRSAKKKTDPDHQSAAVDIVTNRLSLLDRWGKVTDYVSYEDLYDDNNKALGTKVTLLIPKRRL